MSHVFASETVTARKQHICQHCRRMIIKSERYRRSTTVDCGDWDTFVCCQQCQACVEDLWRIGIRDEGDDGNEWYAYLPNVDWPDVIANGSSIWALRAARFKQQWAGLPYPEDTTSTEAR